MFRLLSLARRHRDWTLALGLLVGFIASAAISYYIVTYENRQPAAWYATSFLACGLILLRGKVRRVFAAACFVALPPLIYFAKWPAYASVVLTIMAFFEAGIAAALTLRLSKTPRIANVKQLGRLLIFAAAPACAITVLAISVVAAQLSDVPFWAIFGQAFASHFMGLGTMLPCLLLLATPNLPKAPKKGWFEKIVLGLMLLVFAAAPFSSISYATFMLIFPAATVLAFRLGAKATTAAILALTTNSLVVGWLHPSEGVSQAPLSVGVVILIAQLYTMAVVYNGMFTALAVNHQARIKRHLEERTKISRRARSRALKASQAKTDFLATMSHEIRTPMNGIVGFTQVLLRRQNLEPEVIQQLKLIDRSSAALLTVVNDILDFSKVEAGKVRLTVEQVQLSAIAEEALTIIAPEAGAKGLSLSFKVEGDAAQTHETDGDRLRQVLLNLLNNAVKFTAKGEVRLTLKIKGDRARFEVSDTGAGIPADAVSRLFQRFSQVDGSVTRIHGGTGLGLAISKGLVELLGGEIGVQSVFGQGSTFWFDLPALGAQPLRRATAEQPAEQGAAAAHILLVDDHPVNRQLGRAMLAMIGCSCDEAENGEEAVAAMREREYDLVLMDIHMPVMDGLAATRAIRALGGKAAATPIVALTADMLPECVEKCRSAGMAEHMGKPLTLEALVACLERRLATHESPGIAA